MMAIIKNFFISVHLFFFRFCEFWRLIKNPVYYKSKSYFPEYKCLKSTLRVFWEQTWNILYYGDINEFYFLYGFDIKNFRCFREYVDNGVFIRRRNILNREDLVKPICVLRDKFLFGIFADALGIATPQNIGVIKNNKIYLLKEKKEKDLREYLVNNELDVFIKNSNGECGNGVFAFKSVSGHLYINNISSTIEDVLNYISTDVSYIVQSRINQHHQISHIYNKSINTIRLETILNPITKRIEIFPPLLRVGTGNNTVDNWAMGGLAIGIDLESCCLKEYGFYKPSFGTKVHPDSKVVFKNYRIPYLREAIEMAIKLHRHLDKIHSIGWDIAITEDGPCFIEGNDNWEISLVQICSQGLGIKFKELFN